MLPTRSASPRPVTSAASGTARAGAGEDTLLVGVSSTGFDDDAPLDVRLTPEDLVEAWR